MIFTSDAEKNVSALRTAKKGSDAGDDAEMDETEALTAKRGKLRAIVGDDDDAEDAKAKDEDIEEMTFNWPKKKDTSAYEAALKKTQEVARQKTTASGSNCTELVSGGRTCPRLIRQRKKSFGNMTGLRKSSILLLSLDEDTAVDVFKHFTPATDSENQ